VLPGFPLAFVGSQRVLFPKLCFQVSPWHSLVPRGFCSPSCASRFPFGIRWFPEGSASRF
jgi:hypothetical protein